MDKIKSPCKSKGPNMVKWLFSNPYKFSDTENGRQIQRCKAFHLVPDCRSTPMQGYRFDLKGDNHE